MMMKNKTIIRISIVLFTFVFGMSAVTYQNDRLFEIAKNVELFVNVFKELNEDYVDDLDPNQLMKVGIDAMVNSLDPYTNYISESQIEGYRINNEGKYQGIGAIVEKVGDKLMIIEPYQDSPVIEAGLKAGDIIEAVEGIPTKGKSQEDLSNIVRGVPGTLLDLSVTRPNSFSHEAFQIERGNVQIPNVPYSGEVSDGIGYIKLTTFTPDASKNVSRALKNLKRENPELKGVVLDLRNNGGGLLREAIAICNIFLPKDVDVVSVKGKVKDRDVSYKTRTTPVDLDLPVVVMINKKSASASEIVSGVIQDFDRGVLIGQRSFGKGLVQNTKELGYNSRLKLTTAKYYIPSGRCIQSVEYENGEPKDIPDNERASFKTKRGREVLDGGGVSPDLKLDANKKSEILNALVEQKLIFKYVNKYLFDQKIDTLGLEDVVFTEFDDFKTFLLKSQFEYKTQAEKQLEELNKLDQLRGDQELKNLNNHIQGLKSDDLDEFKAQVMRQIEIEIAGRFHFQKGKSFQALKTDPEITVAVDLLSDPDKYESYLK